MLEFYPNIFHYFILGCKTQGLAHLEMGLYKGMCAEGKEIGRILEASYHKIVTLYQELRLKAQQDSRHVSLLSSMVPNSSDLTLKKFPGEEMSFGRTYLFRTFL